MMFNVNFQAVDLDRLRGGELLRFLVDRNVASLAVWCPRCFSVQVKDDKRKDDRTCPRCGAGYITLDDGFWGKKSLPIKRAIQKDPMLLATVKAECVRQHGDRCLETPPYDFPGPLDWLLPLWKKATSPEGRPFEAEKYFVASHMVQWLEDLGLGLGEVYAVASNRPLHAEDPDFAAITEQERSGVWQAFETQVGRAPESFECKLMLQCIRKVLREGTRKELALEWIRQQLRSHAAVLEGREIVLSIAKSLDLSLNDENDALTEKQRQQLSEIWRTHVGQFFSPGELRRAQNWVQQQTDVVARLRGQRVKETRAIDQKSSAAFREVNRIFEKPTKWDSVRFQQCCIWVNLQGLTKDVAVELKAKSEVLSDWLRNRT
jgi:hypothetical protein